MFVLQNTETNQVFEPETETALINKVQEIAQKDAGEHPPYRVNNLIDALTYLDRYSEVRYKVYRKDEWDLYKLTNNELIKRVVEQIKKDVSEGDTSILESLLRNLNKEQLIDFLPESVW